MQRLHAIFDRLPITNPIEDILLYTRGTPLGASGPTGETDSVMTTIGAALPHSFSDRSRGVARRSRFSRVRVGKLESCDQRVTRRGRRSRGRRRPAGRAGRLRRCRQGGKGGLPGGFVASRFEVEDQAAVVHGGF